MEWMDFLDLTTQKPHEKEERNWKMRLSIGWNQTGPSKGVGRSAEEAGRKARAGLPLQREVERCQEWQLNGFQKCPWSGSENETECPWNRSNQNPSLPKRYGLGAAAVISKWVRSGAEGGSVLFHPYRGWQVRGHQSQLVVEAEELKKDQSGMASLKPVFCFAGTKSMTCSGSSSQRTARTAFSLGPHALETETEPGVWKYGYEHLPWIEDHAVVSSWSMTCPEFKMQGPWLSQGVGRAVSRILGWTWDYKLYSFPKNWKLWAEPPVN